MYIVDKCTLQAEGTVVYVIVERKLMHSAASTGQATPIKAKSGMTGTTSSPQRQPDTKSCGSVLQGDAIVETENHGGVDQQSTCSHAGLRWWSASWWHLAPGTSGRI